MGFALEEKKGFPVHLPDTTNWAQLTKRPFKLYLFGISSEKYEHAQVRRINGNDTSNVVKSQNLKNDPWKHRPRSSFKSIL